MYLERVREPADLRDLTYPQLDELAGEIRDFIVAAVSDNAGHLGSNLGAVELTLALHRVFDSPTDAILWDTGHQAYVHKIVTGRQAGFQQLRQAGGLSGYPSREESVHDYVENSHASTALSYAYGMAVARDLGVDPHRHIVAVIGDGSLTGGMAYEALNNIGHGGRRVIMVLNDNGRSYAPTVSNLSANSQGRDERASASEPARPGDRQAGDGVHRHPAQPDLRAPSAATRGVPPVAARRRPPGRSAMDAFKAGVREFLQPPSFFEALGVRYVGPFDGHDIEQMEHALHNAVELSEDGPILVHVLTQKGRGYPPAEDDDEKHLHDAPVFDPLVGPPKAVATGYTQAFAEAIIKEAEADPRLVAITAAMPGPTGLLPFQDRFPDRCFDVGIAEQHAVTGAAGMAMGGLRPVVAIYSTFLNRAWDQVVYDVALHRLPVDLLPRPRRHHRPRRSEPPRRLRHGPALQGAGDAGARPVERAGTRPDDARRDDPRRRRPGRHPLPTRRGAQRDRARGRHGDRRPQGPRSAAADRVHHRRRQDARSGGEGGRPVGAPTVSRSRCGTRAAWRRSTPIMLADAASHPHVDHHRGRCARRRHRHDDRRPRLCDRPFDPRRRARVADRSSCRTTRSRATSSAATDSTRRA